ncbi:MAG: IS5 family transposase [Candidatus Altiarchaeota archaeon]
MKYSETRVYKFAGHAYRLCKRRIQPYSSKYSKKTYTQPQHVAVLLLKTKMRLKFDETEELLLNSSTLRECLELEQTPDHTTLCKALQRLRPVFFLMLLVLAAGLLPASGKGSIDATGFDRRHASKHYVQRCKMRFQSMKTTLLVDTETLMILWLHATVTCKHDTQILLPIVEKAGDYFPLEILCGDKGYDDQEIRNTLRKAGIRPLIKHREFKPIHKAQNARIIKQDYRQRLMNESINSSTKRKYGDTLTTKTYWRQYKELLLKAAAHNIERCMKTMHPHQRISIKLF